MRDIFLQSPTAFHLPRGKSITRVLAVFALLVGLFIQTSFAQNPANMKLSVLQAQANNLVIAEKFIESRPYLEELVKRFEEEDEAVRSQLESYYYYIGISHLVEYSSDPKPEPLSTALTWFDRMDEEFKNGNLAVACLLRRADCYRGLQQFLDAAKDYERLLSAPLEERLKQSERIDCQKRIVECFYFTRKLKEGEPWFRLFFDEAYNSEDKALAATALVETYISQGKFSQVQALLPYLVGETPSRYKLQFNISLMDAGDRLAKDKKYNEAMFMYRLVLELEDIIAWNEKKLQSLQTQLDRLKLTSSGKSDRLIELEAEIFNYNAQVTELKKIPSYSSSLKMRIARNFSDTDRDWESFWAFDRLIKQYPDSKEIEDFFYFAFLGATEIGFADNVISMGEEYLSNGSWKKYSNDITIKLCEFYLKQDDYESFFALAKRFVDEKPNERYTSQLIYLLGSTYMKFEQFSEMVTLFSSYTQKYKRAPMLDGVYYWLAQGQFFTNDHKGAAESFRHVLNNYGASAYLEDAQYRIGICKFAMEDYDGAREEFQTFVTDYPDTKLRGEAEFFLGDIYAAIPDVEKALKHYALVEKYTDNMSYVQGAFFASGELLELQGDYAGMIDVYQRFINKYSEVGEFTEAVYHMGRALVSLNKPDEMINLYRDAIVENGDDPRRYGIDKIIEQFSEFYFEQRAFIDENLTFIRKAKEDKAFRELISKERKELFKYLGQFVWIEDALKREFYVAKFRADLVEDTAPLDKWLAKFEEMDKRFPKKTPIDYFEEIYEHAVDEGKQTLEFRVQTALSALGSTINDERVFTVDDFDYGSPASLIWMGDKTMEFDPEAARQAYQRVIDEHADSGEVFTALLRIGSVDELFEDYDTAYYYYRQAEELFPAREDVYLAVVKQADVLRIKGDCLEAREVYQRIARNRFWRGEVQAQALYSIGLCYIKENRLSDAIATFERIYIGYTAYAKYASLAYLKAGELKIKEGKRDEAKAIFEEFLEVTSLKDSEAYQDIKKLLRGLK